MQSIFLGVDIAGADNTWFTALASGEKDPVIFTQPAKTTLEALVTFCQQNPVLAVAIDAPLTTSLAAETGFRPSDQQLRQLLPAEFRNWVASTNSLMAVPVRGMLLADHLAPLVGTIIETHPRASLYFGLEKGDEIHAAIKGYKTSPNATRLTSMLWQAWEQRFRIQPSDIVPTDGALDALVCATIACLYHQEPSALLRLSPGTNELRGRGPFYVFKHQLRARRQFEQSCVLL